MNLADITTKCYILALIIRDDGERLLLGEGAYEFKDSQQHFQPNTYANDVVELQGTDGQMLAGQVRRTATQTFAGYIGDATFSKQKVEAARRDFLMFFRKKHYYTAVYIFCDGSAIQRKRGYIVNAPSVPELYQRFPEWSVGLNFEDPNYYEYAEDDLGQEIAAHKVELELSTAMSGGLIWDGDGAVSDDLSYVGTEIPGEGKNFQLADTGTATLKSASLLGDAEQDGTPNPDYPQAVNTVTGEQTVNIAGKNLFDGNYVAYAIGGSNGNQWFVANSSRSAIIPCAPSTTYTVKKDGGNRFSIADAPTIPANNAVVNVVYNNASASQYTFTTSATAHYLLVYVSNDSTEPEMQVELGSTATAYEPYQGQSFEINLGKNLFNPFVISTSGITVEEDGTLKLSDNTSAIGYKQTGKTLAQLAPSLKVGDTVYLYLETDWTGKQIYGSHIGNWTNGQYKTITAEMLADSIIVYGGYQTTTTIRIMITKAPDSTYAPYFTPIELAKIGNYQDRIYKDDGKWYIEKQIGKVVLDGSEANWGLWGASTTNTLGARVSAITPAIKDSGSYGQGLLLSDYFTETTNNALYATDAVGIATTSSNLYFRIAKASLSSSDLAGFKTWLSTHPTTVYYALATPTTIEITSSELVGQLERLQHAHTYADLTNFSITATSPNLPAFLKVVAFGDDAIPQGGYVWEDGGTGGATTITVDGVDNAQPIWTVVGPATNPSLTNITTGESIQWTGVVPNGQTLVVNMADMTASLSGANVFEFISGSWITLQAGNNRVSYSATAATGIATLEWNGVVG